MVSLLWMVTTLYVLANTDVPLTTEADRPPNTAPAQIHYCVIKCMCLMKNKRLAME